MRIAVVGASGGAGRWLVDTALDRSHLVRAVVRRPNPLWAEHPAVELAVADVRDVTALEHAVDGSDAVVWAVGGRDAVRAVLSRQPRQPSLCADGTRALLVAMTRRDVPRLVVISSWGVGDSRRRLPPAFRAFVAPVLLRAELADKQRQEQLVRASDRIWTIVRPSRLTDAPPTRTCRTGGQLRYSSRSTTPRADLAEFITRCLEDSTHRHETVEISAT